MATEPGGRRGLALGVGWALSLGGAAGVRLWNALAGPLLQGYDAPAHVSYVLFLDVYRALPWAHQGWSYFHPPLHYVLGWALAQLGSAEALLRGLALVGSAASLGIAALAARVTRRAAPDRPGLALLAFTAVAFLPVHLYASSMIGNELTASFLGAAAVAALISNECRPRPGARGDVATGLLVGLALLAKFSGAIAGAVAIAAPGVRALLEGGGAPALRRALGRSARVGGVALVVAVPFYARGVAEYGTPFRMNRDYRLTAQVEEAQKPGFRTWRDFVAVPARLLVDPRPGAPHLLHSVWGTAYVNAWTDTRGMWNRLPAPYGDRLGALRVAGVLLGLGPTALALAGAWLALSDLRHRRRTDVYVPLFLLAAGSLAAFAGFAIRVPTVSALKASYLLGLSLPFGAFTARALEAWGRDRLRPLALAAAAWVALSAGVAAVTHASGALVPRRPDSAFVGAVHFHFGELGAAREVYAAKLAATKRPLAWLEGLAAVELAAGNAGRARQLYERALALSRGDRQRWNRAAVAAALDGDPDTALRLLASAEAAGAADVARANRGALLAARGDLAGAEQALRGALLADPDLAPAWRHLAIVQARAGHDGEAAEAHAAWQRAAGEPPRGFPYGVGVGLLEIGARPLLWLDGDALRLARPPFRTDDPDTERSRPPF